MWIDREISRNIIELSRAFPAVILTGARQTGKTSLLRRLFPEHHYVSLDLRVVAEQAEESPESFLRDYPPPVVIDEVQYAPGLFRHLKVAIDRERQQKGQFILTGSQKFTLMARRDASGKSAPSSRSSSLRNTSTGSSSLDPLARVCRIIEPHLEETTNASTSQCSEELGCFPLGKMDRIDFHVFAPCEPKSTN